MYLTADHPGEAGHITHTDGYDNIDHARPQNCHQDDRQKYEWESQKTVHDTHDNRVHESAHVTGDQAQQDSDNTCNNGTAHCNDDGNTGTVKDSGKQITPELVRSENMAVLSGCQEDVYKRQL